MDFVEGLDSFLEDTTSADETFILTGDFNINALANHLYSNNIISIICQFWILVQTLTRQTWKSLKPLTSLVQNGPDFKKTILQVELTLLETSDKSIHVRKISQGEVKSNIDRMDSKFSSGGICSILVKITSPSNRSFIEGRFSTLLKKQWLFPFTRKSYGYSPMVIPLQDLIKMIIEQYFCKLFEQDIREQCSTKFPTFLKKINFCNANNMVFENNRVLPARNFDPSSSSSLDMAIFLIF